MFQLDGTEFKDLIQRRFVPDFEVNETSGGHEDIFECSAKSQRNEYFDILNFTSNFKEEVHISNLNDSTHVSLHFQLSGSSDANISGFGQSLPMSGGRFNILNCVEPVSSFIFPKQAYYEYLCIGVKPSFFNGVLEECGIGYERLLKQSKKEEAFALFDAGAPTDHWQLNALNLLQNAPVADNLKIAYNQSKIKELLLLSLNAYRENKTKHASAINNVDVEKLRAVKAFLAVNYLSVLTLESISRAFLLNEFKLKKGFKEQFGVTVFGYIHQLRMEHARQLLTDDGLTVGEIAAITGYTSDAAFIRAFRLYFGCTPGKWLN